MRAPAPDIRTGCHPLLRPVAVIRKPSAVDRAARAMLVGVAEEIELAGGVANAGAVARVGDVVLRPTNPHSAAIDALLVHLHGAGFRAVPEPLGHAPDGRERFGFIPGDVPLPPFPAWSLTDRALGSTAALLRAFHDAQVGFVVPPNVSWSDEMADPVGGTVICHNDVCPENVVFRDGV